MKRLDDKWTILAVLFALRILLGFNFQLAASIAPFWINELDVDYTVAGSVIGCFMLPGIILAIPSGYLVHYLGGKTAVIMGLALMLTASMASASASTVAELMLYRFLSGSGAVVLFIAMMGIVIDRFQGLDLVKSLSIYLLGWPVGIGIGQATQAPLASMAGWQFVALSCSLLILIGLAITVILYRSEDNRTKPIPAPLERPGNREHYLISQAGIIWMLLNGCYVIFLSYSPIFLVERGMSIETAALSASLISAAFIITLPLAPRLLSSLRSRKLIMSVSLGGAGILGILLPYTDFPVIILGLFGFSLALATPFVGALPAAILRKDGRAIGLGVYFSWQAAGSALLPIPGGYIRDLTGSAAHSLVFGASLLFLCVILLHILMWELGRYQNNADPDIAPQKGQEQVAG